MKKRTLTVIIAVIIVVVLAFSIYKLTGSSVTGIPGKCLDTDNGLNYEVKGTASYENRPQVYTDFCVEGELRKLNEYYCLSDLALKSKRFTCEIACENGVCVK